MMHSVQPANSHGFIIRPSTSPVPNFMSDLAVKRKSTAARSGVNQAAAAANRLRPLPGKTGNALGGMIISGKQTGEEKVLTVVERRESAARPPLSTTPVEREPPASREAQLEKQIRKLEQELRRSKDTVKLRGQEKEALKEKLSHQDGILQGANKRIVDLQTDVSEERTRREQLQSQHDERIQELNATIQQMEALAAKQNTGFNEAESRHRKSVAEVEAKYMAMAAAADSRSKQLGDDVQRWKSNVTDLEKRISSMEKDAQQKEEAHRRQLEEARGREEKLQNRIRELQTTMLDNEANVEDWKTKIGNCNSYIVRICQPQFSVVKDESMTPVATGSSEGGFVLVPLNLMLEGYQLLPGDMKKQIADEYERSKRADAEKPSAGDFAALNPTRPSTSPTPGGYTLPRGKK